MLMEDLRGEVHLSLNVCRSYMELILTLGTGRFTAPKRFDHSHHVTFEPCLRGPNHRSQALGLLYFFLYIYIIVEHDWFYDQTFSCKMN